MDFTGCQPRLDSDFSWRCQQRLGFERCQTKLGFKEVPITIGFWEMPSKVGFYGGANKDWALTLLVGRTWLPNILKLKEPIWIVYADLRKQCCDCEKFQFFHLPWSYVIATCSGIRQKTTPCTHYMCIKLLTYLISTRKTSFDFSMKITDTIWKIYSLSWWVYAKEKERTPK